MKTSLITLVFYDSLVEKTNCRKQCYFSKLLLLHFTTCMIKLTMSLAPSPLSFCYFEFFPSPSPYIIGNPPPPVYFMSIGRKCQVSVSFELIF